MSQTEIVVRPRVRALILNARSVPLRLVVFKLGKLFRVFVSPLHLTVFERNVFGEGILLVSLFIASFSDGLANVAFAVSFRCARSRFWKSRPRKA